MSGSPPQVGPLSMSRSSTGSDFQVISHISPSGNGSLLDFTHLQFNLEEFSQEMTMEEAMFRIQSMFKENQELKGTLQENNAAINQAVDRITSLQNRADSLQDELVKRNQQAKEAVTNMVNKVREKDEEMKKLKEAARRKNSEQEHSIQGQITKLEQDVKTLNEENIQLKTQQEQTHNKTMVVDLLGTQSHAEEASLQEEFTAVNKKVKEYKLENMKLKQELENSKQDYKEATDFNRERNNPEIEKYTQDIEDFSRQLKEANEKCKVLEGSCNKLEEDNRRLGAENEEAEKTLKKKQELLSKVILEKKDLVNANMELQAEYSEFRSSSLNAEANGKADDENGQGFSMLNDLATENVRLLTSENTMTVEDVSKAAQRGPGSEPQSNETSVSKASMKAKVDQSLDNRMEVISKEYFDSVIKQLEEERQKVVEQETQNKQLCIQVTDLENQIKTLTEQLEDEKQSHLLNTKKMEIQHAADIRSYTTQREQTAQQSQMQSQVVSLVNELQETQRKAKAVETELNKAKTRNSELENAIRAIRQKMENQRANDDTLIDNMRMAITNLEKERTDAKVQLEFRNNENMTLYSEYQKLNTTFDQYVQGQQNNPRMREALEQIDTLTAQIMAAEETIGVKDQEIQQIRGHATQLQAEVETIPILQAQAEIWKNDFDAERQSRERVHAEKERLQNEVVQYQLQIQLLQDELETYSRTQLAEMQRRHGSMAYQAGGGYGHIYQARPINRVPSGGGDLQRDDTAYSGSSGASNMPQTALSSRSSRSEEEVPRCPKCNIECPDYDTLNIHVLDCLDQLD